MYKKLSRRSFIKKSITYAFTTIVSTTFGYLYARYIEPRQLVIEEQNIYHSLIPPSFDGTKVVQISDTHIGFAYSLEQLDVLVRKINKLSPDIVIFTGDLIDIPNKYDRPMDIIPILKKIKAPLGKFAIYGNHDHGGYGTNIYREIMQQADFLLLQNESFLIKLIDESQILIAGVDDCILGNPNITKALENKPKSIYTILLAHEPDFATIASKYNIHLQLSGHSHAGQIKIPFYGPLYTPPLGEKFYEGNYFIGDRQMQLYVNRGIGTTRLPLRFLSTPEITVFTLNSKSQ